MSTAKMVALIFMVVGIVLTAFVGFDIVESDEFNLLALGISSFFAGLAIHFYVP